MALEQILLVRHYRSMSNDRGVIQGSVDIPLQLGYRTGVDELTDLIVQEEGLTPAQTIYMISSNLGRTYDTADRMHRRLRDRHHLKSEHRFTEDLKERGQGVLEGMGFKEALPLLSSDPTLSPNAETVYGLLYLSNDVPSGERHEDVAERLRRVFQEYVQRLNGTGIFALHLISGMNHFRNLLTDGNILGDPQRPYEHYPNLSVVRLELDPQRYMRYRVTQTYGPPNHHNTVTIPLI